MPTAAIGRRKLPKILTGLEMPRDQAERIALAELCQMPCKELYIAALNFYEQAFADDPNLIGDQPSKHRYNAACAAVLAGCGQGIDAGRLREEERAKLRRQALTWLQADLTAWKDLLDKNPDKARISIHKTLEHWQQDTDFAAVRGSDAQAKLPANEARKWQLLWEEVESLRKRAAGLTEAAPVTPELVPPPKEVPSK